MSDAGAAPAGAPTGPARPVVAILLLWVGLVVATAGLLHLGAHLGRDLSNDPYSYDAPTWQQPYVRWDAEWYLSIADDGYFFRDEGQSSVAFFPGYPVGVRVLGAALDDTVLAGILLGAGAGLAALLAVHAWARSIGRPELAWTAALVMALTPFSVYLYGPIYGDGLLLAATAIACWALERDRRATMVVAGSIAAVSRVVGAVVPVLLALRLLERRRRGQDAAHPALALACWSLVVVHVGYLWDRFGDPLAFRSAASAEGWDEGLSLSSVLKLQFFEVLTHPGDYDVVHRLTQVLSLVVGVSVLALLPRTARVVSPAYAVLAAAFVAAPLLSNDDFLGFGRYALASFPVTVALADLLHERPALRVRLGVASATSAALVALLLGADYLVA